MYISFLLSFLPDWRINVFISAQLGPTTALNCLANADRQCSSFFNAPNTHEPVSPAQHDFNARGNVLRVSAGHSDDTLRVILIEQILRVPIFKNRSRDYGHARFWPVFHFYRTAWNADAV